MKKRFHVFLIFILIAFPVLVLFGAVPGTAHAGMGFQSLIISETPMSLTFNSPDKKNLTVKKSPKRVVVLLTSLLDVWYEAGGIAVARCTANANVPEKAENLPTVGTFANPSVESILSFEPDLVISGDTAKFRAMIPILQGTGIDYAFFRYDHYYDFLSIFEVFSRITGRMDLHDAKVKELDDNIRAIQEKCPKDGKTNVIIIFSTPNAVITETSDTHTGVLLSMLPAKNVVEVDGEPGKTRINFSMERIVAADPDVILFNTMGDIEECRKRMEKDITTNEAWASLSAVRKNNIHFLPKELFLYKSADKFPKALAYLAGILYPETFKQ